MLNYEVGGKSGTSRRTSRQTRLRRGRIHGIVRLAVPGGGSAIRHSREARQSKGRHLRRQHGGARHEDRAAGGARRERRRARSRLSCATRILAATPSSRRRATPRRTAATVVGRRHAAARRAVARERASRTRAGQHAARRSRCSRALDSRGALALHRAGFRVQLDGRGTASRLHQPPATSAAAGTLVHVSVVALTPIRGRAHRRGAEARRAARRSHGHAARTGGGHHRRQPRRCAPNGSSSPCAAPRATATTISRRRERRGRRGGDRRGRFAHDASRASS